MTQRLKSFSQCRWIMFFMEIQALCIRSQKRRGIHLDCQPRLKIFPWRRFRGILFLFDHQCEISKWLEAKFHWNKIRIISRWWIPRIRYKCELHVNRRLRICNTTYTCGERMQPSRVITLLRGRNYSKSALPLFSLFIQRYLYEAYSRRETLLLINSRFVARAEPDDSLEFAGCSNIR